MKKLLGLLLFIFITSVAAIAQDYTIRYGYYKYADSLFTTGKHYNPDSGFILFSNGDSLTFFAAAQFFRKNLKARVGDKKYHHGIYTFPLLQRSLDVNAWVKPHHLNETAAKAFDWDIRSETRTIAGYSCKLAVSNSFRAWYSEAIPVSSGPAGYYGLPGLILRLEDYQYAITWEAVIVKASAPRIVLPDLPLEPCKGCETKSEAIKNYFRF